LGERGPGFNSRKGFLCWIVVVAAVVVVVVVVVVVEFLLF